MEALPQLSRAERACAPGSIVSDWGGEPVNRIAQAAGTVTIQYGRTGMTRTVHVGTAAHPANVAPSREGHSIGRWENDVLVVDTVGFSPGTLLGSTPHSAQLHVVERFSVDPATTTLKREVTAEDPLFFTAPYTRTDTMIVSTVPYAAEACQDLTPAVPPAARASGPALRRPPVRGVRAGRLLATLGVAFAGLAARGVLAHHSPARYDLQSQRTVEGTITNYEWGNPHVYLSVRETGGDRVWVVEAYPSTAMKQYGWAADTFVRGEPVVVVGSPGRDASRTILFLRAIRKAGSAVALYDAGGAMAPPPNPPAETFRADESRGHVDELCRARGSERSSDPASRGSRRRKALQPSPSSLIRRIPVSSACHSRRRCT